MDTDSLIRNTVDGILDPNYTAATKFFLSYWEWNKKRFDVSEAGWKCERNEWSSSRSWSNTYSIEPDLWNIERVSINKGWWIELWWWWSYVSLWSILFSNWWSIEWNEWYWNESNDRIILKKDYDIVSYQS